MKSSCEWSKAVFVLIVVSTYDDMPSEPNMECLRVHEICQIVHNVATRYGRSEEDGYRISTLTESFSRIPMKRFGQSEDVAAVLLSLVSPESPVV
jgi:NAD(P)-dependent dehydrogenase (short-subunit alcohol dehydrogenase family)